MNSSSLHICETIGKLACRGSSKWHVLTDESLLLTEAPCFNEDKSGTANNYSFQWSISIMPSSLRLDILRDLRERAGLSQVKMAEICGLHGKQSYQTVGAWERGDMTPNRTRRTKFIGYLWDHLSLRQDPAAFERVWKILEEEWQWEPITDQEWSDFTHQPRPEASNALNHGSASLATMQNRQTSLLPDEHKLNISSERLRSEEVQNGLMMWLLAHLAIFASDKTVWCEVRLYTPD